jgi:hypothetical protein
VTTKRHPKSWLREPVACRVRLKLYPIVDDRIDMAVECGWNRAHEHTPTPGKNEICELFDFDPEDVET